MCINAKVLIKIIIHVFKIKKSLIKTSSSVAVEVSPVTILSTFKQWTWVLITKHTTVSQWTAG